MLCLVITVFILSNRKSQNPNISLGTEYSLRIEDKNLLNKISKLQSETDFHIIVIEYLCK